MEETRKILQALVFNKWLQTNQPKLPPRNNGQYVNTELESEEIALLMRLYRSFEKSGNKDDYVDMSNQK